MQKKYDLCVVGAGPAGLMAAIKAAESGAHVCVFERNGRAGTKLLLTGGGRCNISNAQINFLDLKNHFGPSGRFLYYAVKNFGVVQLREFFQKLHCPLEAQADGKIFPKSNKAADVLAALVDYCDDLGVEIIYQARVKKLNLFKRRVLSINVNGEDILTKAVVIAAGGRSYAATGSDGSGFDLARAAGHIIIEPRPALVPFHIKAIENIDLAGAACAAELKLIKNKKIIGRATGDILFTHHGLSGPASLNLSNHWQTGAELSINFLVPLTLEQAERELLDWLNANGQRPVTKFVIDKLPRRLAEFVLRQAELEPGRKAAEISKSERHLLAEALTDLRLRPENIGSFEEAMVTAGGVHLTEINPRTMESKLIENLYFAGEILNLIGLTGGYNLQIAWSTGALAGQMSNGN